MSDRGNWFDLISQITINYAKFQFLIKLLRYCRLLDNIRIIFIIQNAFFQKYTLKIHVMQCNAV